MDFAKINMWDKRILSRDTIFLKEMCLYTKLINPFYEAKMAMTGVTSGLWNNNLSFVSLLYTVHVLIN